MDIDIHEYLYESEDIDEDFGYGIIAPKSKELNTINVDDDDREFLFGDINIGEIGGKNYIIPVIGSVLFSVVAIFCISMRDKSNALPAIGIVILLILNFKTLNELDANLIFVIIPSVLSMFCAYGVSICKEILLLIILGSICIFVLVIISCFVIDSKIHIVFVGIQVILSIIIIYKYFGEKVTLQDSVIQKIMDSTTIKP